jgi:L-serine dehydratase
LQNKIGHIELPFPINNASDLLHWSMKTGLSIHEIVLENETSWRTQADTELGLIAIWTVMKQCIFRGCHTNGVLPGGLQVKRRATDLNKKLLQENAYEGLEQWMHCISKGGNDFR